MRTGWTVEPERISGSWHCFRQVAPGWPPLYHAAGEPSPSQRSARWHRLGEGYAQYLALEPMGAWAELVRFERIRGGVRAAQYRRRLWLAFVREMEIADLSTFQRWADCGLDPRMAVGDHGACQAIGDALRAAGYRGVLSPSAALDGATNLTLFGPRYEKVLLGGLERWENPNPDVRVPCSFVAEGTPPEQLIVETTFADMPHDGYRAWLRRQGMRAPRGVP